MQGFDSSLAHGVGEPGPRAHGLWAVGPWAYRDILLMVAPRTLYCLGILAFLKSAPETIKGLPAQILFSTKDLFNIG